MDYYNSFSHPYGTVQNANSYQQSLNGYQPTYSQQQPSQTLIKVAGLAGAQAFQTASDTVVPLLDENGKQLYIKSTNAAGFAKIETYIFPKNQNNSETNNFVTHDELNAKINEIKEMLENEQHVSTEQSK